MNTKRKEITMNNFKKVGISALAGSLAMVSANAVEYAVTGDAILTFMSGEGNQNGKGASNGKGLGMDQTYTSTLAVS